MSTPLNLVLWFTQGLLALTFLGAGAFKLLAYEKYAAMVEKQGSMAVTRGLAAFIGGAEIAGGLGIVLPMAINVAPALIPWAALGLASIMLLAIGYHMRAHE
jgi:uncharacterized membrane protein